MKKCTELKKVFITNRDKIFNNEKLRRDPYKFCVSYSILVEEYILQAVAEFEMECAVVSAGSFSRRELSPYSDIDIMFISEDLKRDEPVIKKCIQKMWNCGVEVSHTLREYSDIERYLKDDLHTFTQFFETRFILGNKKVYNTWNKKIFEALKKEYKPDLIRKYFDDIKLRYDKYGESAKTIEPNVKFSAGGLRDLQVIEWMYSIKHALLLTDQNEITHTESFLKYIQKDKLVVPRAIKRLKNSYKLILNVRNLLHLLSGRKNDRLEFNMQKKIAVELGYNKEDWKDFMLDYFNAATILKRFSKTIMKRFEEEISHPISDYLTIDLDNDFSIKGKVISLNKKEELTFSEILRAFYYRGLYDARFDENLRSNIIENVMDKEESGIYEILSSVFFREILRLPQNVAKTLEAMNELGVLGAFLSEFKELVGFFQPGVYHCYTADEHTLIALRNLEDIENVNPLLGKIFNNIKDKDILYLAVLFHDIGKPISLAGHEIIGTEIAASVMEHLGYDSEEIDTVKFLVRHHLTMEQVAFRRNLNDPVTLDNFRLLFPSTQVLDLLYLLTYSDLSAVSPVVWTKWKSDLLFELYRKTKVLIDERSSAEEMLTASSEKVINGAENGSDETWKRHVRMMDDNGYFQHYSYEEINQHIKEIESGSEVSVFFKEENGFTSVTVVSRDSESLLSRLCGVLSINDLNIHDARIFTRKDKIVIDSFNVTDFRTHKLVVPEKYEHIQKELMRAVRGGIQVGTEFNRVRSKWWRIEEKFFKRKGSVKIEFEQHENYTIIDVFSPDRLGLLYKITRTMNELGLSIHFAKVATKSDDVVDAFYVLNETGNKVSQNQYELIRFELTEAIEEML